MKPLNTEQSLSKGHRIWMGMFLGALAAFGSLSMDMYLPGIPGIAKDFQTNASTVQLSLTACLLGLAGGQIVIGPLSDMKGRKRPLLSFLIVYMSASIFCALAPNIWTFIAARFIQGFSASAGVVIARAIVRDTYSGSELTKHFATLVLVVAIMPIIAPIFGSFILQVTTTWNGIFWAIAAIALLMSALVFITLPETLPQSKRSEGGIKQTVKTFGDLIKDKTFMGYALAQGLIMGGVFAYVSGTPFVYQEIYGVSPQIFSFLFALNGIGIMIGSKLTGRLSSRISERKILSVGLVISITASLFLLVMTIIEPPLVFIVIPLFLIVSCIGVVQTTCFSLAMQQQGQHAGSASALLGLLPYLLGSITAPLVGIAGEQTAVPMGITILVVDLGALASYLFLARKQSTKNETPPGKMVEQGR